MSIVCTPVDEAINKRAAIPGRKGFVRATIDPETRHQLNLPIDYQFHGVFLPQEYAELSGRFQNFEVRSDDIWICGWPKTGTIWMQNIARKLTQKLDFNIPLELITDEYFEAAIIFGESNENEQLVKLIKIFEGSFERINRMPSPRIIKTHLPAFLLPKEIWTKRAKVIYMARNPKDAIVSGYHMARNRLGCDFSMEQLFQLTINDEINFAPLPKHVLSFWQLRNLDHVLFLTYEELSADRFAGCKKISQFLGYSYDDGKLQQLADLVEFKSMKKRMIDLAGTLVGEDPNYRHCRKGQVGGYRNEMSQEWIERFDQWIADRFRNSGFDYSQWI